MSMSGRRSGRGRERERSQEEEEVESDAVRELLSNLFLTFIPIC